MPEPPDFGQFMICKKYIISGKEFQVFGEHTAYKAFTVSPILWLDF